MPASTGACTTCSSTGKEDRTVKSYRKELWYNIERRRQLINITPEVEQCLAESGIREGLCLVNAMHN